MAPEAERATPDCLATRDTLGYRGDMAGFALRRTKPRQMLLSDVWALFNHKLFSIPSTPTLFNPYNSSDPRVDLPGGDAIRRGNLLNYLRSFATLPSIVLVGEAPGWRGCRFSGVPFTSEAQLCEQSVPFSGRQSSANGTPYREATASIFWNHLWADDRRCETGPRFFAWNCVPCHPHQEGRPLSNRTPSLKEIVDHADLLTQTLQLLSPEQVVAVGRSAQRALERIGVLATYVRHPSRGGAARFKSGLTPYYQTFREASPATQPVRH